MPNERRAFSRLEVLEALHGQLMPFRLPVALRDLSVGGFSLESAVPFRTGSQYLFRFTTGDGAEVVIESTIIHCRPMEAGADRYVIGCAFVLDAAGQWMEKVSALLDTLEMPAEPAEAGRDADTSSDAMSIHVCCPLCGGSVTLLFDTWTPQAPAVTHHQAWRCPHCREPHANRFPGKLDRAVKHRVAAGPPAAGVRSPVK